MNRPGLFFAIVVFALGILAGIALDRGPLRPRGKSLPQQAQPGETREPQARTQPRNSSIPWSSAVSGLAKFTFIP